MKPLTRCLYVMLACTRMHTQISRGSEEQRKITMQEGLMDRRADEGMWDPQAD